MNADKIILSLCDYSGAWSRPYQEAGYDVVQIDLALGQDVRLLEYPGQLHGILAAPPCTDLARSGAVWWKKKGDPALLNALAVADACLRFVAMCKPAWWCLENPEGRLRKYYGPPAFTFDPADYNDLADGDESYNKKTLLWGRFTAPLPLFTGSIPQLAKNTNWVNSFPESKDRAMLRSVTPTGFARAFFMVNK